MGLEMWFKEDLRNILLSVNASSAATALWSDNSQVTAYRSGYQEALMAVGLACGIPPAEIAVRPRVAPSLGSDARGPGPEPGW
jgi:hypothetical protein